MAFFDNIGKKISDLGQGAVTKTRDLADSARISAAISDEERKINSYYSTLGRLYYSKYADSAEDEFLNIVNMIKDSNRRIEEFRAENRARKGLVKCPGCGAENTAGSVFCCTCGSRIIAVADNAAGPVEPEQSYEAAVPDAETPEPDMAVGEQPGSGAESTDDKGRQRVCGFCGATLEENAVFCSNCGTRQ